MLRTPLNLPVTRQPAPLTTPQGDNMLKAVVSDYFQTYAKQHPADWLMPKQAVTALKFPNPVQGVQAVKADADRTFYHLLLAGLLERVADHSRALKNVADGSIAAVNGSLSNQPLTAHLGETVHFFISD